MQRLRMAFVSLVVLTAAMLAVPGPLIGSGDLPDAPLLAEEDDADDEVRPSATLVAQTSPVASSLTRFEVR